MKVCPLKFGESTVIHSKGRYKCETEDCAWWNIEEEKCVVHSLHHIADGIWNVEEVENEED
jgi:hypothetical protein